ncbi:MULTISPECIES: hypothetical protein [Methylobacterium]|nr:MULTISPECIES: hypothetical protein [Methylobacterium]TXN24865.1 hypothetical protein FV217_01590 [Methylobacterium sp. WL9]
MALVRHIALLLALAIATIVVSLTPSSAQAHDGHAHASVSISVDAARHASAANTVMTVQAEARIDCTGPCCAADGHHGSCCCATGLAPEGTNATLPPMASARSLSREHASPDGIVPEALPEPPRPFA